MQKSSIGTELDLAILGALEVQPRIELKKVAQILGVSNSTITRRWDLMQSEGAAWTTVIPGARFLDTGWSAFVTIECDPQREQELAKALCNEPAFGTVALVTHHRQFYIDCFAPSHNEGMEMLQGIFRRLPGIRSRHISPISRVYRQANEWNNGTLATTEKQSLEDALPSASQYFLPDELDAEIVSILFSDARQSWQNIAVILGASAQTIQRRTKKLVSSGLIAFRCDSGRLSSTGLQEFSIQWSAPSLDVDVIGQMLANDPSCRISAKTIDSSNLTATFWLRNLKSAHNHENSVLNTSPRSYVQERFLTLSTIKRGGQILDAEGRRVRSIPIPILRAGKPYLPPHSSSSSA
ncbi:AsnC family transcriptional regulator [Glutamicibacter sp.]|uniref:Lrp/AsnC family transcriptional regulator n=1 Tax=Glutamicibacter sp. TaxID=1931995 RepID=UPI0028BD4025|nr:AsnC family transcriptional regulator [Glutamicibacter sp.]